MRTLIAILTLLPVISTADDTANYIQFGAIKSVIERVASQQERTQLTLSLNRRLSSGRGGVLLLQSRAGVETETNNRSASIGVVYRFRLRD